MIGVVSFLLDALDLLLDAVDLIVLLSYIRELPLEAIIELIRREQKFAIIQGFLLIIYLCFDLTVGVLLPHIEVIILLKEDFALSLKFFKIIEKRLIDLLNTIDDDTYEDIVRTKTRFHQFIYIVSYPHECPFQHLFVLTVHTDAYGQFQSFWFLEERDVVILMLFSDFLDGEGAVDLIERD